MVVAVYVLVVAASVASVGLSLSVHVVCFSFVLNIKHNYSCSYYLKTYHFI